MIDIQLATETTYTHQTLNNFSLAELKGLRWHQIRTQTSHRHSLLKDERWEFFFHFFGNLFRF